MLVLLPAPVVSAGIKTLENGDKVSWDGCYYDFCDSERLRMIKLWVPPGADPVRGILIMGHGGSSGDTRNFARDGNVRDFAAGLGFGLAGLHNFPGREVYDDGAPVFFRALDEFAKLGHHPELANVPFAMYGSSNGGASTYGFVNYAPERAICFLANVGPFYNPEIPVDEALHVPGIHVIGKFDLLVNMILARQGMPGGVDAGRKLMKNARSRGALWSWAVELKGHEDGYTYDVYTKLVEQAVAARYPETEDPAEGKVRLKKLKEEDGWLVDQSSWGSGLTYIARYGEYEGDPDNSGWVLNKDMAYVYRSLATHYNPLSIVIPESDNTYDPSLEPGHFYSLGGPVMDPGKTLTVGCDAEAFADWQKIEFFNGAEKLGEVRSGNKPEIEVVIDGGSRVYCITALATGRSGDRRTCPPRHFFVRDPSMDWHCRYPESEYAGKKNKGSKNAGEQVDCTEPDPEDSVLVAYGLTAEQEKQFSARDGKLSGFWEKIDDRLDYIEMKQNDMRQRNSATDNAEFNFCISHDCNVTVKAAYGGDGVYLLFEINDDQDVPWPNGFTGTEMEMFYHDFDAVNLMMDSRPVKSICKPESKDMLISRYYGMTSTSKQYQVACGTEKERPQGFKRTVPAPWDFHAIYFTFEDARSQFGFEAENIKTSCFYKAQELFIPWSEYGGGLSSEPDAGTRLAFSPGFNDRDPGEHMPPGVNQSGHVTRSSNGLRWIGRKNPWHSPEPPYAWGEIELGAMLE